MHPPRSPARLAALCVGAALLTACADSAITAPSALAPRPLTVTAASDAVCSTIDFNGFSHVSPVTSVSAAGVTFAVSGTAYAPDAGSNPNNVPLAWNTDAEGIWEDGDLLVPRAGTFNRCPACSGLGTVLLIEDERNTTSDHFWGDSRWGGVMKFTAAAGSGTFYIESYTAIDQEPSAGDELALHLDNSATAAASATGLGDASVETVVVAGQPTFTSSFEFRLGTAPADGIVNSGAIDNIRVCRVTPPPPPPPTNPGTGTPGYWKHHSEAWPASIVVGGVTYTPTQAIALMKAPTRGDKTYNLFEHLVSAKLNVGIGNDASCISADIAAADAWLAANPIGDGIKVEASSAKWAEISGTFSRLTQYNEGQLCAPHRG